MSFIVNELYSFIVVYRKILKKVKKHYDVIWIKNIYYSALFLLIINQWLVTNYISKLVTCKLCAKGHVLACFEAQDALGSYLDHAGEHEHQSFKQTYRVHVSLSAINIPISLVVSDFLDPTVCFAVEVLLALSSVPPLVRTSCFPTITPCARQSRLSGLLCLTGCLNRYSWILQISLPI